MFVSILKTSYLVQIDTTMLGMLHSLFSNVIVWKKIKQQLFPFKYNTNANTTIKKWKGWENRKFLCPFNYYINTITIKKWKVIKVIFLEVYCKPKHDVKTLKTHTTTTLICKNTWTQRMTNWAHIYTWVFSCSFRFFHFIFQGQLISISCINPELLANLCQPPYP